MVMVVVVVAMVVVAEDVGGGGGGGVLREVEPDGTVAAGEEAEVEEVMR